MKRLFGILLGIMILLSVIAVRLQPPPDGKLVWISDDNPRRTGQITLFDQEQRAGNLNVSGFPTHPPTGLKLDPNNSGMEKIIVQTLGGVGPDLFDCYTARQLSAYVRSGVALDVTEALKARGISIQDIWPCTLPACVYNGHVYGWPNNAGVDAIWLNKDLFAQAGVPLPTVKSWTWQEFIPLAQKLTKRDSAGRVVEYGFLADWPNIWQDCLLQWGGHFFSPDGTRCVIDSPQAIAGVQFAHDLIYKYHIMPSPVEETSLSGQGGWGQGTIKWFGAGKGAMALGGRWWLCTLRDQTHPTQDGKLLTPTLRMGAVECPHGPLRVYMGYGRATLVSAASPRVKEALDFLIYMSRKPYNDLINAQADALAPVKKFCYTPEYDHNPDYPEEDYNEVWRRVMDAGAPEEICPFADGQAIDRIITQQMDLIKSDQKSVPEALHTAAQQINAEIQKMLAHDPTLRRRYEELTHARLTRR
jgi:multiple sugar transport system substrate-binding protein